MNTQTMHHTENIAALLAGWKKEGHKIISLTAYDYPMAKLLDESGIDIILVGDSLGMVVLGMEDTTTVTMEHMLHHTRAAAQGTSQSILAADLPTGSYDSPALALENAKLLADAGAQAVKFEGALEHQAESIVSAGIPLIAHLGMLPQHVRVEGGYHMKGRSEAEAEHLLQQALAMQDAGACALVLEIVQKDAAKMISEVLRIPTIGIGSGEGCDGQILVTHDLIGMFPWFTPKFVRQEADVAENIKSAVEKYIRRTRCPG